MTPTTLGRYELLAVLGHGGYASVYRAWDPGLGREVALKALLPHLSADPEVRRRFLAEGKALAALRHPNIVTVYDVGEADGRPFLAMELIGGESLAELLARQHRLSLAQTAGLLGSLCSAIDYLHAAGLIHRDIKPANVLIDPSGRAVLTDFGIARALDATQNTATGASIGTPQYMAPEQVRGTDVGPATDIYALGILAYQALAGQPPFAGDTASVLHAQAYQAPPPLHRLQPGLPDAVYAAVAAALAKDPARRPVSGAQFYQAFSGAIALPRLSVAAATGTALLGSGGRRTLLLGLAAGIVVLAVILTLLLVTASGGRGPRRDNLVARQTAGATAASNATSSPAPAGTDAVAAPATSTAPCTAGSKPPTVFCEQFTPVASPRAQTSVPATSPAAAQTATTPPTVAATASATRTPPPAIRINGFRVENTDAWASGQSDLRGCFSYDNASADDGLRVRVAHVENRGSPVADGALTTLNNGSGGPVCSAVARAGAQQAGGYVALLYDQEWRQQAEYLFTVQSAAVTATAAVVAIASPPPGKFHAGQLVRVNTPNDCLLLRAGPTASETTGRDCVPDGAHVRILAGPQTSAGIVLWNATRWNSPDGAGGWAREDYLAVSPDCDRLRDSRDCDTAVPTRAPTPQPDRAPTAPSNASVNAPSVAGDWTLTDHVRYGTGAGDSFTWTVHLTQQGTQISGSSDAFTLNGTLSGSTLRATYRQGSTSGAFAWTFTADGTRFEGAFSYGSGNGGTSYGHRTSGTVSKADLATVSIVGAGVNGDRVSVGGDAYVCFTVSRPSRAVLTSSVAGGFKQDKDDDGTGDCIGVNTDAPVAGQRTFHIQMLDGNTVRAEGQVTVTIGGS